MWFVNVVIPYIYVVAVADGVSLCFNAHSPEAIHSIMEVVSVSTQLCHQFLTSEPLQPYRMRLLCLRRSYSHDGQHHSFR